MKAVHSVRDWIKDIYWKWPSSLEWDRIKHLLQDLVLYLTETWTNSPKRDFGTVKQRRNLSLDTDTDNQMICSNIRSNSIWRDAV